MKKFYVLSAVLVSVMSSASFAEDLENVTVKAYDCSLDSMKANNGKCELTILSGGKELRLLASPEVGAAWGNSYGPAVCHPTSELKVSISNDGEIITVKDASGAQVATKFDYSK